MAGGATIGFEIVILKPLLSIVPPPLYTVTAARLALVMKLPTDTKGFKVPPLKLKSEVVVPALQLWCRLSGHRLH